MSLEPFAVWIERDVVVASGPDTVTFLQGQLSQDVEAVPEGASAWTLLLQPTGKVDAWLRLTRVDADTVELDVDAGWGDHVRQRLDRFKLRTRCELELRPSVRFAAVRGTEAGTGTGTATETATATDAPHAARPIVWPGATGADIPGATDLSAPEADEQTYERARILAGVPAMGRELTEATIPVEAGQWLIDASVSFTKGCYTGQELVARVDSRGGNAPRPIRILRVDGRVAPGAPVRAGSGDGDGDGDGDGRELGTLTSAEPDGEATVALAPLLRAAGPGDAVTVDGHRAVILDPPT